LTVGLDVKQGQIKSKGAVVHGGDYAEYLPMINPKEDISNGDIVGVFAGKISRKTKGADQIMVISTEPGVLGNAKIENTPSRIVAFLGQVPVRVIGKVNAGDLIIPSGKEDGVAIAVSPESITANQLEVVVGRAWESSSDPNEKMINLSLTASNQTGGVIKSIKEKQDSLVEENKELKNEIQSIKAQLDEIKALLKK